MDEPLRETPSRRGRPVGSVRVKEQRTSVGVVLPTAHHDQLCQLAYRHDISVGAVVRKLLILQLEQPDGE